MEEEFTGENADLNAVKAKRNAKSIPVDMDFEFVPNNPYSLTVQSEGLGASHVLEGEEHRSGFFETAVEEFKAFNATYTGLHAAKSQLENPALNKIQLNFNETVKKTFPEFALKDTSPYEDIAPAGWNPKKDPSKLVNISSQYLPYLMEATGPKDLDYRLERVREEQHHDEVLANGSTAAKILGGFAGAVSDPMTYIPIAALAKYGKVGANFFKNTARAFPGVSTYAVLQSASEQADKVNGNLQDFFQNAMINSVFGSALFGVGGVVGLSIEKMNMWDLGRKFAKAHLDGFEFKLKMNEKGEITGLKALQGEGQSGGAASVQMAQDLADSAFAKTGVFKVPFLGDGLFKLLTMPWLGTPLPALLNHHYKSVAGVVDRFVDHSILTTGLLKGEVAPVKFETLMKQSRAGMTSLYAQTNSLLMERNGFEIGSRPVQSLVEAYSTAKNKTVESLGNELGKTEWISRDAFYDEIQTVLRTKEASQHAPVNTAAAMYREKIDNTYKAWRKAYNLPEDWIPPNVLEDYLMRVYDTPYLNTHEDEWTQAISQWLKEADETIIQRMEPITALEDEIKLHKVRHEEFIRSEIKNDVLQKRFAEESDALRLKKKSLEENLQNELRENPEMFYHVEDWNALSANEVKEINAINKNRDSLTKDIEKQKKQVSKAKEESTKSKAQALKAKTTKTAEKQIKRSDTSKFSVEKEEEKLRELEEKLYQENVAIQEKLQSGEVNPRLYYKEKDSHLLRLKDTNERLKFRNVYESHMAREHHAKAYYDTILNQTPEDTINQVMGKVTGNQNENHLKSRTLNVPDKILYDNNFMTKDLFAKTSNYVNYLSRRTNLKTVFNDVTMEGGFEPVLEVVNKEFLQNRGRLNDKKAALKEKLKETKVDKDRLKLDKEIRKVDKALVKERKLFEDAKSKLNHIYEKAMGLKKTDKLARNIQSGVMSVTAWSNLGFVPLSMLSDLSTNAMNHGLWAFVRDGVYPIVESFAGILKTKDSESLRGTAANLDLGLQDMLTGWADKNWGQYTQPYFNQGKVVNTLENIAHVSSNVAMTNYIENGLQRVAGAVTQGEFMRILDAFVAGTMTEKEGLYLRKYGLDYKKWGQRMVDAFKQDGGGKNKLGGYQSLFWKWQDLEAANEFSRAVFRGVQATSFQRGLADSPFWADNALGALFHGFSGWMYASVNRLVIPSMQQPDARSLVGVTMMLGLGYFVTPLRRLARGEEMFPETQTAEQRFYETVNDSGYFSYFSKILNDADILSGGNILGDLKSDKYRDRTRVGLLGPAFGQANRMFDVISAAASNEMNEADAKKMARMVPFANTPWTWWMSRKLVEGLELPKTRAQAKNQKG